MDKNKEIDKMLKNLIKAADIENWDYVDANKTKAVRNPEIVNWAYQTGVSSENENRRDLAVSLLEKAKIPKDELNEVKKVLGNILTKDSSFYVRFRAACALVVHSANEYRDDVIKTLREAAKDKDSDVKEIAKGYLEKFS